MKTNRLTPPELISVLSVAAVELYAMGRLDAEDEVALIRTAIPLIARAYGEGDAEAAVADELIQSQHELMELHAQHPNPPLVMEADDLFNDPTAEEIFSLADALLEVVALLEDKSDRDKAAELLRYMMEFWELEDQMDF